MAKTRRAIAGFLCAAFLLLAFGVLPHGRAAPQGNIDGVAAPPLKFLVLGDSIAAGSGVYINKENRAYAPLVARAKGYDLTNYGAGGDTSADLLGKVTRQEATRRAIGEADVIAVSIGGNDLMHAEDFTTLVVEGLLGGYSQMEPILAAYRENFAGIISGIRALNAEALLIVQTLYNPAFPLPSLREAYGAAIRGINAGIRDYLEAHPGAFVVADVYTAFQQRRGAVFVDMTHPSAHGHAVIAEVLLATIDETEPQLPRALWPLDALLWVFRPVLAVLDYVCIGGMLRAGYRIAQALG